MSSPNQNSSHHRYLKARLKSLMRPSFWVSAGGLSLALLLTWQYWNDPEWFDATWSQLVAPQINPAVEPSLSSEELAARMADIDSSQVLLQEFDRTNLLPVATQPNQKSKSPNSGRLSSSSTPQQAEASSGQSLLGTSSSNQNASNPLGLSAPNFSNIGTLGGSSLLTNSQAPSKGTSSATAGSTTDPLLGFNSLDYLNSNRGTAAVSPLQEALNRVAAAKAPTANNSDQAPATTQSQASSAPTYQGQVTSPPVTFSGGSGYTTPGQWASPPATIPSGSAYNAAGQPISLPATAPTASGYNAFPTTPTAPVNLVPPQPGVTSGVPSVAPVTPSNFGQYPTQVPNQAYGVTNPAQGAPRLQPSQLNRSSIGR